MDADLSLFGFGKADVYINGSADHQVIRITGFWPRELEESIRNEIAEGTVASPGSKYSYLKTLKHLKACVKLLEEAIPK